MPCQVYDGKCVLLNSFRSPDLYFDFLKKCSALYLQTGKFERWCMHLCILPRFCCWLPIHHSMKCVQTIFTTDIVNIFYSYALLLQMSMCITKYTMNRSQWNYTKSIHLHPQNYKISIFQHWSTVNTCALSLHGQNVWTTSLNIMLICML